jgi:phage protein U
MLFDTLETAAKSFTNVAGQAQALAGVIARADTGIARTSAALTRLADSYLLRESSITAEASSGNTALAAAGEGFMPVLPNTDASRAARTLSSIDADIRHAVDSVKDIRAGAAALAGANKGNLIQNVGAGLSNILGGAESLIGQVQRAYEAVTNLPGALPGIPEPTFATPDTLLSGFNASLPDSGGSRSHLLILTGGDGMSFYFNLTTAGFDTLKRQTAYNIATQDRLTRRSALQAVSKGGETLTLSGAIFTSKSGAGQMEKLRAIGVKLQPLLLTTGYGESFGYWYLTKIDEDQAYLFTDGMPRKQTFSLEFQRYGEDYQNV